MSPPAREAPAAAPALAPLLGARSLLALGGALLLLLALATGWRWLASPALQSREEVVQMPVPPDAAPTSPRPPADAPDPGD